MNIWPFYTTSQIKKDPYRDVLHTKFCYLIFFILSSFFAFTNLGITTNAVTNTADNTKNKITTINFTTIATKSVIITYTAITTIKINIIQINVLLNITGKFKNLQG